MVASKKNRDPRLHTTVNTDRRFNVLCLRKTRPFRLFDETRILFFLSFISTTIIYF